MLARTGMEEGPLARGGWLWRCRFDLHRLRSRVRLYFRYCTSRTRPTTQLLVVGAGRSGTSLLTSYLHSLPDVSMRGEVLNPRTPQGRKATHRGAARRHIRVSLNSQPGLVGGVKITLQQLRLHGLTTRDLFDLFPNPKFLVIYRRSLAEQYVSHQIARRTGSWQLTTAAARPKEVVRVNPNDFVRFCAEIREGYEWFLTHQFVRDRALVVRYEELVEDSDTLFREGICPFLRIEHHPVSTGFRRQNPYPLREKVENFAQVRELLTGPDAQQEYRIQSVPQER